ncbi:Peregrin [Orchesella cincta]|uniref:Peregrin n=1 Tax=Orchesella cincta TaxID=48709 RepID=A0A1D2MY94_ORCCI|nr:Peregrin [Orchesella cincta]
MPGRRKTNRFSRYLQKRSSETKEETVKESSSSAAGNLQEGDEEDDNVGEGKVLLVIDGVKFCEDVLTDLDYLMSGEENENKVPEGRPSELLEQDVNPSLLAVPPSVSTPLKRSSPLSPTFQENVLKSTRSSRTPQQQQQGVESFPLVATPPKSDVVTRRKRKRLRISSETESEVQEEHSPAKKHRQSRNPIPTPKQTSQKVTVKPTSSDDTFALPVANFRILEDYKLSDAVPPDPDIYLTTTVMSKEDRCKDVQYELDEQDIAWLYDRNVWRAMFKLRPVAPEEMELLIDRFEKEIYYEMHNSGLMEAGEAEEDAVCCICLDGESDNWNQIIFCDLCNIPVHQDCYGVPFIPEGSYQCRRCSISPNLTVECIFCPNKEGAFKQTVDGRWAHVVCALWIPEVRFSNASLVEPVDDIDDIPASRWKLSCFLCKTKGVGACIQCLSQKTCYTAFHVTCGQAAGYGMKLEVNENTEVGVKLVPSCDKHTNPAERVLTMKKVEAIDRVMEEKRATARKCAKLMIRQERVNVVKELIQFHGRDAFVKRLKCYWKLKRDSRSGAPLLRNLELMWCETQYPPQPPPLCIRGPDGKLLVEDTMEYFVNCLKNYREDLTKIRTYAGVQKLYSVNFKEFIDVTCQIYALKLQSSNPIYHEVIKKLDKKDTRGIFSEPVLEEDAPDYFSVISQPMDLSTMEKKAKDGQYQNLYELEADFNLMIDNCITFNDETTMFHKTALKMREHGKKIFQDARNKSVKQLGLQELFNEPMPSNAREVSDEAKTETKVKLEESVSSSVLQPMLNDLLERLAKNDKQEIFSEPVDPDEVPEYNTIIKKPMDFSTMRNKINNQKYSSVEDLEADYFLMLDNCMQFNEDHTSYFKLAVKMKKLGERIFTDIKPQIPSLMHVVKDEIKVEKDEDLNEDPAFKQEHVEMQQNSKEHQIMVKVLKELIALDEQEIFTEPVSIEDVPDYLTIVQTPMDFSLMQKKQSSGEYSSLDDLEKDFNLMIDNCKLFNGNRTKYYKIAVVMKEAGDAIFINARENS